MSEKKGKKSQQETEKKDGGTTTPTPEDIKEQWTVRSWACRARVERGQVVEGSESEEEDVIAVRDFVAPACFVRRSFGLTLKLADYESARMDVGITIPCYREELNDADKLARDWCEQKIEIEVEEIRKAQGGDEPGEKPVSTAPTNSGDGPLL